MIGQMNNIPASSCIFLVLLVLSFSLSVTNVADENKTNKAFPICTLIVNSLIIFIIILQQFKVNILGDLKQYSLVMFFMVLTLSFILSIVNVSDDDQENKSLSVIVLIVDSLVLLLTGYALMNKIMNK